MISAPLGDLEERMANLPQMSKKFPRHYRIAIQYEAEKSLFSLTVGLPGAPALDIRHHDRLSEIISDLYALGIAESIVDDAIRNLITDSETTLEDVPITDKDLERFRRRKTL
jgi:hypothetical protein